MKPLAGYIFLFVAITCGIIANSLAKMSDGFTKLTPSVACILLMCITMFSLAKGMSAIPVGFAYATYSAITVASILIFGIIKYNQIPNIYGLIGIVFITIDNVYIHPTIVIAVRILGINNVKPWAPLAKPFDAVPKTTARINII